MNFVGPLFSPIAEIMKCSCAIIFRRIGYIKNLERNFQKLNEKAIVLYNKKEDVQREIERHGNSKVPTSQCQSWLDKVGEIQHQVNAIEEQYSKEDKRCLGRWCLHIPSSWTLGRRVVETTNRILNLSEEFNFEGGVVVDALPQTVEIMPVRTIEDGTSTERTLQKILECMRNQKIVKIGIWGMGGVGKTTVMKALNNLQEKAQMFEKVIWVTVAQDCNTRKLQSEIAHRLDMSLSNDESNERVAMRLFQRLRTMKFLLLMDDIWAKVDLEVIGIPSPNQENGCKLVLTTRYRNVCHKMETNEEIRVELLSKNEAWKLFREKVGEVVDSPSIEPLAKLVAGECKGLPLAIIVVGASLRKEEDIRIWKNALQELSSPATSDIYDMEREVFRPLQFSFDRLEDDNVRNCFLYAALFPEDYEIDEDELIEYWRAEGLINSGSTLEDVRNKGHAILKHLIDASLLLQSFKRSDQVKMHDVIRDLALRITSPNGFSCRFLVRANKMIAEPPENDEWQNVNRMSLMDNEIGSVPERPNCPTLLTLLLQSNTKLKTIPNSFFEHMHALRVLDLSHTDIESLPHSICNLVSLRGLYLRHCRSLKSLPPQIGAMTKLEVLDAKHTKIDGLPVEIGQLTHLKVLIVAFSMERDANDEDIMISGGIISRLSQLEELSIDPGCEAGGSTFFRFVDICNTCDDLPSPALLPVSGQCEDRWNECGEVVMKDVSCLQGLVRLEFYFPKVESLEFFIQTSRPWKLGRVGRFMFHVGEHKSQSKTDRWSLKTPVLHFEDNNTLTIYGCDGISNAILEVLGRARSFQLIGHRSIHSLCEFGMQNLRGLICCAISGCDAIEIVIEGHQLEEAALPNLSQLIIHDLQNLRSIFAGPFPTGSLNCLTCLYLSSCNKLKNIFSCSIIEQLSNLIYLSVKDCSALEEVICEGAIGAKSESILPNLVGIYLTNVPGLVTILKGHLLNWSSLEEIFVYECCNLKRLPISINNAPKLRCIDCEREWWNELEWDDNAIKLRLEPLLSFHESQLP